MYNILKHAHSGLRWFVLIALVYAIYNAFTNKGAFTEKDKKINLFALIFTHTQFVLGLILYFVSDLVQFSDATMRSSMLRFYTVEHASMMVLAIVMITVGYSKSKRAEEDAQKFKFIRIFYLIGLLIILAAIPWPFRALGAGWF